MKKIYLKILENYKAQGFEHFTGLTEKVKNLNVMLIGDAIIDEYIYTDTLGKSAKESILATLKKVKKNLLAVQ